MMINFEYQLAERDPVEFVVGNFEVFRQLRVVFFSKANLDSRRKNTVFWIIFNLAFVIKLRVRTEETKI